MTRPTARSRFVVLDGLRGIAAAAIVLYHAGTALGIPRLSSRAYLAVDFFFVLSGFVIAHAYESALVAGALRTKSFLIVRLIRLWPLTALGTAVGVIAAIAAPRAMGLEAYTSLQLAIIFAAALVFIPNPISSQNGSYSLNTPLWSIVFEIAANYTYGLFARRLTMARLAIVVGLAAVWLTETNVRANTANAASIPRVAYSFFLGVLLYRQWFAGRRLPAIHPAALAGILVAALFAPDVGGLPHGVVDTAISIVVFPAIVFLGAGAHVSGLAQQVSELSGEISYPLYALHYPVVLVVLTMVAREGVSQFAAIGAVVALLVVLVAAAFIASRLFDKPVRRALMSRRRDAVLPNTAESMPTPVRLINARSSGAAP